MTRTNAEVIATPSATVTVARDLIRIDVSDGWVLEAGGWSHDLAFRDRVSGDVLRVDIATETNRRWDAGEP